MLEPLPDTGIPAASRQPAESAVTAPRRSGDGPAGLRLDAIQISATARHRDNRTQTARFSPWEKERRRWIELLDTVELSPKRKQRMLNCGATAWLQYSPSTSTYYVTGSHCGNRVCPACRHTRQMRLQDNLERYFHHDPAREWQFITLTLKHTQAPLDQQITYLRRCFKRLRSETLWHSAITHGFAVIEITRNFNRNEWHPHLHVLAHTRYLDWSELRSAWSRITHGSNVIDCQKVKTAPDAIHYIAAYMGKPPAARLLEDDQLAAEWYRSMQGQHLLIRFGRPDKKPPPAPPKTLPADCRNLGLIEELFSEARQGSIRAYKHLEGWLHQRRCETQQIAALMQYCTEYHPAIGPPSLHDVIHEETDLNRYRDEIRHFEPLKETP